MKANLKNRNVWYQLFAEDYKEIIKDNDNPSGINDGTHYKTALKQAKQYLIDKGIKSGILISNNEEGILTQWFIEVELTTSEPETAETAETVETVETNLSETEIEAIISEINSKCDLVESEELILLHDDLAFNALKKHQRLNTIESYNDYRVNLSERNRLISDYIQGLK